MYLAAAFGCLAFYWAYREWLSWVFLMAVVFLPWLSLLLSLPAMILCRVELRCPIRAAVGDSVAITLGTSGFFPAPKIKGRVRVKHLLTGKLQKLPLGAELPTGHCGGLEIYSAGLWVCDYLGLFCLPVFGRDKKTLVVRPAPVPLEEPPDMSRYLVNAWKPKPGGGYSENHELRLYRPGDDLRNIHWKLAAKVGKPIYREPMEPLRKGRLLTMTLCGKPKQLDKKLGQLLWLSQELLQRQMEHEVLCLTGDGPVRFTVTDNATWEQGLRAILRSRPAKADEVAENENKLWQYHIGGDGNDA